MYKNCMAYRHERKLHFRIRLTQKITIIIQIWVLDGNKNPALDKYGKPIVQTVPVDGEDMIKGKIDLGRIVMSNNSEKIMGPFYLTASIDNTPIQMTETPFYIYHVKASIKELKKKERYETINKTSRNTLWGI